MSPSESAISLIVELGRLGSLLTEAGVMVSLIAFDFKNKAIQQSTCLLVLSSADFVKLQETAVYSCFTVGFLECLMMSLASQSSLLLD